MYIMLVGDFMEKKCDLRVIKTKNLIYSTLMDLMKEKTFEEIRVSDICNRSLINRSTFYAHYEDKYELLVDFINNLKEEFVAKLSKNRNNLDTRDYYIELIKVFLDYVEDKKDIYSLIMLKNRNSIMMDILLSVVNDDVIKRVKSDEINTKIPGNIIAKFYLGGVINLGVEWLKDDNKYTKEDIIKYLDILIPDDFRKF